MTRDDLALLQGTRERLVTNGWKQDGYGGPSGPVCWMGAMAYEAGYSYTGLWKAWDLLEHQAVLLGFTATTDSTGIVDRARHKAFRFNDEHTFTDVLARLDAAIETGEKALATELVEA